MSNPNRLWAAFLVSLLLHLLLMFWGVETGRLFSRPQPAQEVELMILQDRQIADIAPPEKEERPSDDAKFIGLYDSKVEKEQVAPTRPFQEPSPFSPPKSKPTQKEKGEGEGKKTAAVDHPDHPAGEGSLGSGIPDDFYPDYQIGDRTYLNVLKYPEVAYFVRMKKVFKMTFNPAPSIRSSFYMNQISKGQVEVVLAVTVDRQGRLNDLFVIRSSGLSAYDAEALRTIRDSSPFSAPPAEFLDDSSLLRMAWTFTVYL